MTALTTFRWDPFQQLARLRDEVDELFGRIPPLGGGNAVWRPAVDVRRTDGQLVISLDLPGMTSDDIDVQLHGRTLVVSGERREQRDEEHEGYFTRERSFGSFTRSFVLPDGAYEDDDVRATFENGVLELVVDLPDEMKPRRIQVQSGERELEPAGA